MTEVTVDQLAAARADGSLVVDVREPAEYVTGHVPGALLLPAGEVAARRRELPRAARCTSSVRPATAADA